MLFASSAPSPYDLSFQLFGIPVRITPFFWVVALFLASQYPLDGAVVFVAAVLVSIVVHELGHAFVQRAFGGRPSITLYAFGGLASAPGVHDGWWRQVLISLAGPFAGFFLAGMVWAALEFVGPPNARLGAFFLNALLLINIAWGVINLAPIWPLDGGRVARELFTVLMPPATGIRVSLWVSMLCAALVGVVLFVITRSLWNAALFGMLAYQSYETLQQYRASRGGW
ncbi:Stage IV sporulation protein FB [Planctomycetes bacterium MalM25]|nr:Stage IV sporulation protein FB [Planctomycetes bacterium MalM25]